MLILVNWKESGIVTGGETRGRLRKSFCVGGAGYEMKNEGSKRERSRENKGVIPLNVNVFFI